MAWWRGPLWGWPWSSRWRWKSRRCSPGWSPALSEGVPRVQGWGVCGKFYSNFSFLVSWRIWPMPLLCGSLCLLDVLFPLEWHSKELVKGQIQGQILHFKVRLNCFLEQHFQLKRLYFMTGRKAEAFQIWFQINQNLKIICNSLKLRIRPQEKFVNKMIFLPGGIFEFEHWFVWEKMEAVHEAYVKQVTPYCISTTDIVRPDSDIYDKYESFNRGYIHKEAKTNASTLSSPAIYSGTTDVLCTDF